MDYSGSNITLSDSLSGYITANEDECDNSRYLSVLSQDLTLQEMNVTLTNEQMEEQHGAALVSTEETNHPLMFTVDGTDEIYGVQVAQDEEGNLQKYQIQYSENMNGELVPLLETIQLLPLDYEEQVISSVENCSSNEVLQSNENFVIRNEEFTSPNSDDNVILNKNLQLGEQKLINEKAEELNTPATNEISFKIPVKKEPVELFDRNSKLGTANGNIVEIPNSMQLALARPKAEAIVDDVLGMENNGNNIMAIQQLEIEHCLEEELYEETIEEKHFEQLFLEENHIIDTDQLIRNETLLGSDQQNELYHILNGVAANTEDVCDQSMHSVLKETVDHHPKTNILKKPIQKSLLKDFMNSEQKIVYVQTLPEKENLTVMDIDSFTKPNSRSLLKCNQPQVLKQSVHLSTGDEYQQQNLCTKAVPRTKETKPIQTYFRTKEAKEIRQFMNFINSTTIPQVPERKGRLPRKQQIKPVKHPNEDIVVKEMIVSSNGFVEPISAEERKYLPVTEYVELLDSGDEMCNDKKKKKNNEKGELIEIEISDTDESDIGIVDIETTSNSKFGNEARNAIKKKRGRPPKSKTSIHEKTDAYPNSPPKISRLDSDVESVTCTLQVIRMENDLKNECAENASKSEENTARNIDITMVEQKTSKESSTNIQHNLIREIASQIDAKNKVSSISNDSTSKKVFEYKYECEKCKTKFINKFLQNRHNCVLKVGTNFSCDICQQKFSTTANLNLHKKSHVRVPSTVKPNPTKLPQAKEISKKVIASSSSLFKSSISTSRSSVISKPPVKIPPRQSVLPSKNPRPSSICVKTTRGSVLPLKSKQLALPIKTTMQLARNSTLPIKNNSDGTSENALADDSIKKEEILLKPPSVLIKLTPEKSLNTSLFKCEKQCNHCPMRFDNHSSWFDHQVLKHGLKTPDKNIGEKKLKKIVKEKVVHNGIRSAPAVAKNFSVLKNIVHNI